MDDTDLLQYHTLSDSDKSNSSKETLAALPPKKDDLEIYDIDDEACDEDLKIQFRPLLCENLFVLDKNNDTILIGLMERQQVFISGIFCLQIVKGGILYGNTHYSASRDTYTVWHPLCDSIPSIQGSYYAGWEEKICINDESKDIVQNDLKKFPCIIKLHNSQAGSLLQEFELYQEVRNLWREQGEFIQNFTSPQCEFVILNEAGNRFLPLHIDEQWLELIERLGHVHRHFSHDVRIMVLGGKNAGKSTLLRLLTQNFLYGGSSQEEILYFDLDPGQPEFSPPDCISLNQLSRLTRVLGKHMGQPFFPTINQHYLGCTSPQDIPHLYLRCVDELVEYLDEENYMGTSLMNLPGWIRGFGLNIINHVIDHYKPTHVIILESRSSQQYFDELHINSSFTSPLRDNYHSQILRIPANSPISEGPTYTATTLRTAHMLAYFHTETKSNSWMKYNFDPLVEHPPLQISFGSNGIQGIRFFEEFEDIHKDDIRNALQGTIVGLHLYDGELQKYIDLRGPFPLLRGLPPSMTFFSLALIHSIDVQNKLMNVYIPGFKINQIDKNTELKWIMVRGKTEAPSCELYPSRTLFNNSEIIPYISTERRKKYEHIWKVRRNLMRRGYHIK